MFSNGTKDNLTRAQKSLDESGTSFDTTHVLYLLDFIQKFKPIQVILTAKVEVSTVVKVRFLTKKTNESKLVNQDNFFESFVQDLRSSKSEVIVESPFITSARMESAIYQKVIIIAITKII